MSSGSIGLFSRVFRPGPRSEGPIAWKALPPEQHVMQGLGVRLENGVAVIVPPRYHRVVTIRLRIRPDRGALQAAQSRLERELAALDEAYEPTPAGLGLTVAWGLPYFRRFVPRPAERTLPVDLRASAAAGHRVDAVLDAVRFPSDPEATVLEENDAAVLMHSDSTDHIERAAAVLFGGELEFWEPTSTRKGFMGGDGIGLPKEKALAAGIPGAELIPDGAQLFLGFTSSQKAALGSDRIANFETIPGATDQWPDGYFRHGTMAHLSHLFEDLEAWYRGHSYEERVARAFRPGLDVPRETQTVAEGPAQTRTEAEVVREFHEHGVVGHSAALQPATRLPADLIDNYGTFQPQGSAVPQRADFNTLDNPFAWTIDPARDRWSDAPAAGLHFLVFAPTSDGFVRSRLAMDGRYADGTVLPIDARAREQGMNAVLRTTHRQNFLVPPRLHRAFPLAELL